MKSYIRCYAYSLKHDVFFFGCENIFIIFSNKKKMSTLRFDCEIVSI